MEKKPHGEKLHRFMEHFAKFGELVQTLTGEVYRLHAKFVYCNSFLTEEK
jgi:hypothetical protein